MEEFKDMLKKREQYLLQLKKEKENKLKDAPEGHLRVCQSGNKIQYYKRTDPKDFNGTYINEKDVQIACELAQKDYDKKILHAAEQELKAIRKYISAYPAKNPEQIYESLHTARQRIIVPIKETDEQFVRKWEEVKYQRKEFYDGSPEFYTAKGERVRSKSEIIIADALYREGIPYRCEYPVYIKGIANFYPDFMILDVKSRKEILWEHFGMMDDTEYVQNLICTFETREKPLNQKTVKHKKIPPSGWVSYQTVVFYWVYKLGRNMS